MGKLRLMLLHFWVQLRKVWIDPFICVGLQPLTRVQFPGFGLIIWKLETISYFHLTIM